MEFSDEVDVQVDSGGHPSSYVKSPPVYYEFPQEIPDDVRTKATEIYMENVHGTKRKGNRLFVKYTCICAAMQMLHDEMYDPYKIADIFHLDHTSIGTAFKADPDISDKYGRITRVTPMKILRSRKGDFGFEQLEDFFVFVGDFFRRNQRNELIQNSDALSIAAGIFSYYCEISGISTAITFSDISKLFNISSQTILQKKELIKSLDNS